MRYAPVFKRVCLGLVLGGAFGNLIDRIATGKVIDFIDMGIGSIRWPTYNVADIAVTVGAVILIAGFAFQKEPVPTGPPAGLSLRSRSPDICIPLPSPLYYTGPPVPEIHLSIRGVSRLSR